MRDYYALLHIKPDASPSQIDAAYRRLMQKHHPNARSTNQALDRLRDLNEAWRVLSDPTQRAAYDRARAGGAGYQPPAASPAPRALPQSAQGDFGARRSSGSTCIVALAVVLVLVFAIAILGWGLTQAFDMTGFLASWQAEIANVMPFNATPVGEVALELTPTPDPRCRDGCATPPADCVVKGEDLGNGERYFYLPNDEGYSEVEVNPASGDRWFCALNDAQAAGWTRRAPTPTPTLPPPPEVFTTTVARRNYDVCAENALLLRGPGEQFTPVRAAVKGERLAVTGVNGAWSVITLPEGIAYLPTDALCAPPTRAPAAPTTVPPPQTAPVATVAPVAASAAASSYKYPAVALVSPTNGSKWWCTRDLQLEWASPVPLGADEYFLIESKAHDRERWDALADWMREPVVVLHPNRGGGVCDTVWWSNTGVYEWRVSIVRGNKEMPTYLSPFAVSVIHYAQ